MGSALCDPISGTFFNIALKNSVRSLRVEMNKKKTDIEHSNYRRSSPPKELIYTARKTIFYFSKCFEKMIFPKKLHWYMIFLVLSGKVFLFPRNMILSFRRKRKYDLCQKNTWKLIVSCISGKENYYNLTKNSRKFQASVTERCTSLSKHYGMFRQNLLKVPAKKLNL